MKSSWLSPYFKSSVYLYWLLCKLEIQLFLCKLQYELYQDPGKGNVITDSVITTVITDSVITTIPIAFIFTRYCLFFMFYWFLPTIEKLLGKMYVKGALISKSRNIALKMKPFYIYFKTVSTALQYHNPFPV